MFSVLYSVLSANVVSAVYSRSWFATSDLEVYFVLYVVSLSTFVCALLKGLVVYCVSG